MELDQVTSHKEEFKKRNIAAYNLYRGEARGYALQIYDGTSSEILNNEEEVEAYLEHHELKKVVTLTAEDLPLLSEGFKGTSEDIQDPIQHTLMLKQLERLRTIGYNAFAGPRCIDLYPRSTPYEQTEYSPVSFCTLDEVDRFLADEYKAMNRETQDKYYDLIFRPTSPYSSSIVEEIRNEGPHAQKAPEFLKQAIDILVERGKTYDSEGGERSVKRTVEAFNLIFNTEITEEQGWHFLLLLKLVRQSSKKDWHRDSAQDAVAYAALAAEAGAKGQEAIIQQETENPHDS